MEAGAEIAATVMRTGCAHHEPDLTTRASALRGSLIVLPVATTAFGMGALAVWSREPFRFQQWHENLLGLHCDVLSLALGQRGILGTAAFEPMPQSINPGTNPGAVEADDATPVAPAIADPLADPGERTLDPLTGLLDRSAFEARLQDLLDGGQPPRQPMYLIYLDIDRFRLIRDYGGDQAADRVIRIIADILRRHAGHEIALGRLGGDEFGVVVDLHTLEEAVAMAQRLIHTVDAQRMSHAGQPFDISISIGLAAIGSGWRSGSLALRQARDACRVARHQGGGAIQVYSKALNRQRRLKDDGRMLNHLTGALKENRLRLFAQPIAPASSGAKDAATEAVLYEVLLRMHDQHGNLHGAGVFLPLAERYGLSVKLDRWVVRETFRLLSATTGASLERTVFTVNLSGHSIDDHRLLDFITEQFAATGLSPGRICFEITETAAISDIDAAKHFIRVLKDIGCKFALDDFGSGHSSFLYLRDLEVDYLKIDGNLVREITRDPVSLAFVRSIDDIGKIMGKQTIAEYVEDDQVLEAIVEIGIDFAQGYWIGAPEPLERWLS
ncbi:diguanylate cyclase (GGDEF) domain-containing protein [Thiocystis violascens DSM 198]|uniref:Diguanylate cyclase (GGDEF) domain-containing protein n=2 Tax=Thiocystis violascens TaxID=73141 RepID=I3Y8S3_THIV6|nr:diguanylate cyclase (GGDEF) domain-containing protein [Thiocystis violascens DSM 198]